MTLGFWLRWMLRAGEVLAAATVLLVLTELHAGIVQTVLTGLGVRTDVPLVEVIGDECGTHWLPPVWAPAAACSNEVVVLTTAPPGQEFGLFVNDRLVARRTTRDLMTMFGNVRLRPGPNSLLVEAANAKLGYPHPLPLAPRRMRRR
jgi:hypothetical protein